MNNKIAIIPLMLASILLACSGQVRRTSIFPEPLPKKAANKLIEESSKHLGEPYHFGGMSSKGWDCSGFVYTMFLRDISIELPRASYDMYTWASPIPVSRSKPGDLIFFNIGSAKPSHVGIYLGDYEFIHVSSSDGVIKSSLSDPYYKKHFLGIGRIPRENVVLSR
jgi:cell wall-associated NlpC family hydrolase